MAPEGVFSGGDSGGPLLGKGRHLTEGDWLLLNGCDNKGAGMLSLLGRPVCTGESCVLGSDPSWTLLVCLTEG